MNALELQGYRAENEGDAWTIYGASGQVIGWIDRDGTKWRAHGKTAALNGPPEPAANSDPNIAFRAYLRWAGYVVDHSQSQRLPPRTT